MLQINVIDCSRTNSQAPGINREKKLNSLSKTTHRHCLTKRTAGVQDAAMQFSGEHNMRLEPKPQRLWSAREILHHVQHLL